MTAMTRHPAHRALAALILLALVGCGSPSNDDAATETWPMSVDLPGLLGYIAVDVRPGELDRLFVDVIGVPVDGLAESGRMVLLQLDETTHGAGQSLAVPVADPDAVRAFLDAPGSGIERLDAQRLRVTLDTDSEITKAVRMVEATASGPQGGLGGIMSMFGGGGPLVVTLHVEVDDEHLMLAPSFEGLAVTRAIRGRVPGLAAPGEVDELVAVWDVERIGLAYHDRIQAMRSQIRTLFSAAPAAGFGAMMMAMRDRDADTPQFPRISADVLDALLKMSDGLAFEGLRIEARRGAANLAELIDGGEDDEVPELVVSPLRASLTVPDGALLTTLRPAPDVAEAEWVLGADADAFAAAAAAWCRPLAELKHGRGQVAEDAVADLERMLAGWGGSLAAGVDDSLVVSTDPVDGLDLDGLVAWFAPIVEKIGDGGETQLVRAVDDTWRIVSGDGDVVAAIGAAGDGALWVADGDRESPPLLGIEALLRARAPEGGPVQRFTYEEEGDAVSAEFYRRDTTIDLELAWSP